MGSERSRRFFRHALVGIFCFAVAFVSVAGANERIVLKPTNDADLEEIRASVEARRVRRLENGSEVWEVPAGTRAQALQRLTGGGRFHYVDAIDGNERRLFADLPVTQDLTPSQNAKIAALKQRNTVAAVHTVPLKAKRFTPELLESSTADRPPVVLNVAPGKTYRATGRRVEKRADSFTWHARLAQSGEATLVVRGENIAGQVRADGKVYSIRPLGGGLHASYEVKRDAFPPEHRADFQDSIPDKSDVVLPTVSPSATADASVPRIDVMVVYPASYASSVVDVDLDVRLAVDLTNETYANSKVRARLNLVHHQAIDHVSIGQSKADLAALEAAHASSESTLASLRDSHAADLVVMIVEDSDYCGEAADILAVESKAFAVVRADCASENYSFAHELGHLFGARHDIGQDSVIEPIKYAHGHLVGRVNPPTVADSAGGSAMADADGAANEDPDVAADGESTSFWEWLTDLVIGEDPKEAEPDPGTATATATETGTEPGTETETPTGAAETEQPAALPIARTIMAYDEECGGCERIPYWSTPDVQYKGHPLGSAELENNARVLSTMAPTVAGFRNPQQP